MSAIMHLPIGTALSLGITTGLAAQAGNVIARPGDVLGPPPAPVVGADGRLVLDGTDRRSAVMMAAGPVLMLGGVASTITSDVVRPTVDRYVVDAAEQVTRRTYKLDWSGPAGRYGALAAGLGIGLTIAGPAALSW